MCKCKLNRICNVAIQFARMWGVAETLDEAIPNHTSQQNADIMLKWAKEYVDCEKSGSIESILEFFRLKLEDIKQQ